MRRHPKTDVRRDVRLIVCEHQRHADNDPGNVRRDVATPESAPPGVGKTMGGRLRKHDDAVTLHGGKGRCQSMLVGYDDSYEGWKRDQKRKCDVPVAKERQLDRA